MQHLVSFSVLGSVSRKRLSIKYHLSVHCLYFSLLRSDAHANIPFGGPEWRVESMWHFTLHNSFILEWIIWQDSIFFSFFFYLWHLLSPEDVFVSVGIRGAFTVAQTDNYLFWRITCWVQWLPVVLIWFMCRMCTKQWSKSSCQFLSTIPCWIKYLLNN